MTNSHESQNTEFKSLWQDDYLKWICGFANAIGGIIYIGKDDNGKVIGLMDYTNLMEDLPNKIRNVNCQIFTGSHPIIMDLQT